MKEKGWLSSLWGKATGQDYHTVGTMTMTMSWTNTNTKDYASFIFQETPNGKRRVKTAQSSSLFKANKQYLYYKHCVPWREGQKELIDVPGAEYEPYVYEELGYKHLGASTSSGTYEDTEYYIDYHFFENKHGDRRVTRHCGEMPNLYIVSFTEHYQNWLRGKLDTDDIPYFQYTDGETPVKSKPADKIQNKEGNITRVDFTQSDPKNE